MAEGRRIRLTIEYDGTEFHGWQVQPGARTVQEELEKAHQQVTGERVRITGAGRTDGGAHALGQVAHTDTSTRLAEGELLRAYNAVLPRDVTVREVRRAPDDFHARYSARAKVYVYRIDNRPVRPAVERRYRWHCPGPLDLKAMSEAAGCLVGLHDFSAFRAASCGAVNPVREVERVDVAGSPGELVEIHFEARSFLQHMVRIVAGTLVDVGRGRRSRAQVLEALESRDRRRAGPTAPPHGLYLVAVRY